MDFEALNSGRAMVCHREHQCDAGVGQIWFVLLSDGFLIDCGHGGYSEARANILAEIINSDGPDQWQRLGKVALREWRRS